MMGARQAPTLLYGLLVVRVFYASKYLSPSLSLDICLVPRGFGDTPSR